METFSNLLKQARSRKKYTLRQLSALTMISVVYINQLERGMRYQPSGDYLQKLCFHLDISYDYASWLTNQLPQDIREANDTYPNFNEDKLERAFEAFRKVLLN